MHQAPIETETNLFSNSKKCTGHYVHYTTHRTKGSTLHQKNEATLINTTVTTKTQTHTLLKQSVDSNFGQTQTSSVSDLDQKH